MKLFKLKCVQCTTHQAFGGWGRVRSSIQDSRVFFFGDFFFLTKKGQHCCANNWLLINFTGHKKKTLSNLPPVQKKRNIKWLEVISCITLLFLLIVLCFYICLCLILFLFEILAGFLKIDGDSLILNPFVWHFICYELTQHYDNF